MSEKPATAVTRRKFLKTGLSRPAQQPSAAPSVVKAQGPISMRWQSTCLEGHFPRVRARLRQKVTT